MPAVACQFGVRELPREVDEEGDDDVCNSGDALARKLGIDSKLVWHVRHGQSTGNVAREKGLKYQQDSSYADAPLTKLGKKQAREAACAVSKWREQPTLIVSSAMTRSIQTAAMIFGDALQRGDAQLVIRPEIR
jgi:broad specificity phosphatase PhoE